LVGISQGTGGQNAVISEIEHWAAEEEPRGKFSYDAAALKQLVAGVRYRLLPDVSGLVAGRPNAIFRTTSLPGGWRAACNLH
jgi:hypothetical protein